MEFVEWLILLAVGAGVVIVVDGVRRARRTARDEAGRARRGSFAGEAQPSPALAVDTATGKSLAPVAPFRSVLEGEQVPAEGSLIGRHLAVFGCIEAAEPLTVAGCVEGRILAERQLVTLQAGARCAGHVSAARLECHEGARFQGRGDIGAAPTTVQ